MIINCASKMPPVSKLSSREIDALSIEWTLLVLEDLPFCTEENKTKTISISKYWRDIFDLKDIGDSKYPVIEKVVKFALSIAEANASVERLFSQLSILLKNTETNWKPIQ
ncbi:unnamed protein product [Meganyctiphanes norvegica]|uniref:HAT C-terminal dimerisation domain-containing protein n=1 Tax=Meganyctiphanes norvegica TaxID=48144 RepID=A0AAV2S0R9_MEGNR